MAVQMTIGSLVTAQTAIPRRRLMELLKIGKVRLNGGVVGDINAVVGSKDRLIVDGEEVTTTVRFYYYKFNKPKDVITSLNDSKGRRDISYFLEKYPDSLFPVGRLDRHTTGLLILTNDGDFAYRLTHPKHHIPKTYEVTLNKRISMPHLERLATGFFLDDGPVVFNSVAINEDGRVTVQLDIGRNRIVRRSFAHLGYEVEALKRVAIGPITLGKCKQGALSPLTKGELGAINSLMK